MLKKRKSQAGLAWADGEERARIEREGRDTTGEGVKPKEGRRAQEGKEGGRGIRKGDTRRMTRNGRSTRESGWGREWKRERQRENQGRKEGRVWEGDRR